jgi:hypothetical protein
MALNTVNKRKEGKEKSLGGCYVFTIIESVLFNPAL